VGYKGSASHNDAGNLCSRFLANTKGDHKRNSEADNSSPKLSAICQLSGIICLLVCQRCGKENS
ncbi:MAG: hypothetical protein IIV41_01970, partial [Akkermansia sp.]|nr:hypothetical protein [Akkermansia sp.]